MEMVEEESQNEITPNRIRSEEEDRISSLPDCLIVEILSRLLDTKDAITTGTLSKRWQHVWTYVPDLIFRDDADSPYDFISIIDKTLTQCRRQLSHVNKFTLDITYSPEFESQFNNVISYAVNRNVRVLDLKLWPGDIFKLLHDHFFFTTSCFTRLKLDGCILKPSCAISWTNLKRLSISRGELREDLIQNILSGTPLLETLKLRDCYDFNRLDITSKSLKNLLLCDMIVDNACFNGYTDGRRDIIIINAPHILSLTIKDAFSLDKLVLLNVSSLVEANLNYSDYGYPGTPLKDSKETEEEILKGLILSLNHVKEFRIGRYCLKAFSPLEAKGLISPLNMKNLHIASPYNLIMRGS